MAAASRISTSLSTSCSRSSACGGEGGERDDHGADPRGRQHRRRRSRRRWGTAVRRGCPCRRRGRSARAPAVPSGVGFGVADALVVADQQRVIAARAGLARRISPTVGESPGMVARRRGSSPKKRPDRAQIGLARRCSRDGVDDRDLGGNLVARQPGPQDTRPARRRRRIAASRSSTIATGVSPRRSSGRPTTAAPATAGWLSSAVRTSSGITLNPPRMIA